jgi:hypothetical protein
MSISISATQQFTRTERNMEGKEIKEETMEVKKTE